MFVSIIDVMFVDFLSCDTGYCPAFYQIGEKLGPFDLSLIPIGAYNPVRLLLFFSFPLLWSERFLEIAVDYEGVTCQSRRGGADAQGP